MTADERWSHPPGPLRVLLCESRAKAASMVRPALEDSRREWLARRWGARPAAEGESAT